MSQSMQLLSTKKSPAALPDRRRLRCAIVLTFHHRAQRNPRSLYEAEALCDALKANTPASVRLPKLKLPPRSSAAGVKVGKANNTRPRSIMSECRMVESLPLH